MSRCKSQVEKSGIIRQCKLKTNNDNGFCMIHQTKLKIAECPICYENVECEFFKCGHNCCLQCSTMWFEKSETCPMCRTFVRKSYKNKWDVLKKLIKSFSEFQYHIFQEIADVERSRRHRLIYRLVRSFDFEQIEMYDSWRNF